MHGANGTVTVATRPTAIVSLSPTATEMLYAIGAGSQVKAVDEYSDYPSGTPRTGLDGDDPNVEAIASYKPDLVVVSQEAPGLNQQLVALGIPVLYDPAADNLAQEYAQFEELGKATGHAAQAGAEVASLKSQIAKIVASVHKPAHSAVLLLRARSDLLLGDVEHLHRPGARACWACTASPTPPRVPRRAADTRSSAASTSSRPIPATSSWPTPSVARQSAATVAARPGWSNLAAVKDGRVLGLNDDIASRWGPRIVILLREVAAEMKQHPVSGQS